MKKNIKFQPIKIGSLFKLSIAEEVANAISHGLLALIYLISLPFLSVYSYNQAGWPKVISTTILLLCHFLMLICSCLYHSMAFASIHKKVFRILDHCAIYFAIAGTFSPVCIMIIHYPLNIIILVIQWLLVLIGIINKSLNLNKKNKTNVLMYIIMGWMALILIKDIWSNSLSFFSLVLLGGILYSIGTLFYIQKNKAWYHFIWHCFIVLASLSHVFAITFLMK